MDEKMITDLGDQVKGVAKDLEKVRALPEEIAKAREELASLQTLHGATKAQLDAAVADLAEYKATLRTNFGKSGADDWRKEFSNFIKSVWHLSHNKRMPDFLEKAAADYVTDVDAQGGYLVPVWVADQVNELSHAHGQIWPRVGKLTMPAGASMKFPWKSTESTVSFRAGTSSGVQGVATTEMDPAVVYGVDTLQPAFANGWVKIANEAMQAPGISIPDNLAMDLSTQLLRLMEMMVIKGYVGTATAHTGRTAPHNGILYASNTNTQTPMATVTLALIDTFIAESIADHEACQNTDEYSIITNGGVAHALKSTLTQQGVNWGDVARGSHPTLRGYDFVTTPHAKRVRTTDIRDYIIMAPLGKVTVAWTGGFSIGFNDSLGWASNETYMMVSTHADLSLGNPDMYSLASFNALS